MTFISSALLCGALLSSSATAIGRSAPRRQAAIAGGLQYTVGTDPLVAQNRGAQALALLRVPWQLQLPGWQIVFRGPRKGYLAMTLTPERRIEIYVRNDRPLEGLAHDIAHELGHAIDVTYNGETERANYLALRGLNPRLAWWTCSGCTDLDVPAGDFAETFAQWAGPEYRNYSNLGGRPSQDQLRAIARALYPGITADGDPAPPRG